MFCTLSGGVDGPDSENVGAGLGGFAENDFASVEYGAIGESIGVEDGLSLGMIAVESISDSLLV